MTHPFQRMLDASGVTNFAAHEFWSRPYKGGPRTIEPDPCKFDRMIPTAVLLQKIRTRYGKPLRLSAYRDDHYNKLVKGGKDSEHLEFRAADLFPVGEFGEDYDAGDLARLKRVAKEVVEEAHADGLRTGLGIYPGFVHVDTGSPKGRRRRWYGT